MIVERASGQTLVRFANENIFAPLGMSHTRYNDDHASIIPNRATGYAPRRVPPFKAATGPFSNFATDMSNFEQTGDGAVQTSIEDLLKWDENFYTAVVGGRDALTAMQTPARLNDGQVQTYAFGLMIEQLGGLKTVSHGGSWAGYRAELLRFPEEHLSVACLCNLATTNPSALARRVAQVYLGDKMHVVSMAGPVAALQPRTQSAPSWSPSAAELAAFAGSYYSEEIDAKYVVRLDAGRLVLQHPRSEPETLAPSAPDTFAIGRRTFRFTREGGRPTVMLVDAGRIRNVRFVRQ
jgi:hypothetical protein